MEMVQTLERLLVDIDNLEMDEKVAVWGLEEYLEIKTITGWK